MARGPPVAGLALADHTCGPAQRVQPIFRHAQAGMISRMPGRLQPPVAAHHRRRDRRRLEEHHQVAGTDPACPGRDQRRTAVLPQPRPAGEARSPTRIATICAWPSSPKAASSPAAGVTSHGTTGRTTCGGSRAKRLIAPPPLPGTPLSCPSPPGRVAARATTGLPAPMTTIRNRPRPPARLPQSARSRSSTWHWA
jgi:hypothetical protein